jgi:uncharacterized protein (TIGR02246 family)
MKNALLLIACCVVSAAQDKDVLAPILKSAEDWNRGDLKAFMQSYENSPDTTFVGSEVAHGTDAVLARYRRTYSSVQQMGKTTFSDLKVRPLSPELAVVTGRYTLDRAAEFGGRKTGIFTLVMRKSAVGWRIIHDHTSATN